MIRTFDTPSRSTCSSRSTTATSPSGRPTPTPPRSRWSATRPISGSSTMGPLSASSARRSAARLLPPHCRCHHPGDRARDQQRRHPYRVRRLHPGWRPAVHRRPQRLGRYRHDRSPRRAHPPLRVRRPSIEAYTVSLGDDRLRRRHDRQRRPAMPGQSGLRRRPRPRLGRGPRRGDRLWRCDPGQRGRRLVRVRAGSGDLRVAVQDGIPVWTQVSALGDVTNRLTPRGTPQDGQVMSSCAPRSAAVTSRWPMRRGWTVRKAFGYPWLHPALRRYHRVRLRRLGHAARPQHLGEDTDRVERRGRHHLLLHARRLALRPGAWRLGGPGPPPPDARLGHLASALIVVPLFFVTDARTSG